MQILHIQGYGNFGMRVTYDIFLKILQYEKNFSD
jgi:hypothetical protein